MIAQEHSQPQLTLDGQPDPPRLGEWLRRKDTRIWAEVEWIAVTGGSHAYGLPIRVGDVVMCQGPGRWCVSSPGKYFWDRWERVAPDEAAKVAMQEAAKQS